ncbi:MAG: class I SAM-dependent methyltransferase [Arenicellales bacterium]
MSDNTATKSANSATACIKLGRSQQSALRSRLFRHLDGFPIAPTMVALKTRGVLDLFSKGGTVSLDDITSQCQGNEGYLQVALRLLCSQGWLVQDINPIKDTVRYTTTNRTAAAFEATKAYEDSIGYLEVAADMHHYLFGGAAVNPQQELALMLERHSEYWGMISGDDLETNIVQKQVLIHLEGMILAPVLVALGMNGALLHCSHDSPIITTDSLSRHPGRAQVVLDMFSQFDLGRMIPKGSLLNEKGLFFVQRAAAYGVTVSYLPMFQKIEELLFGNPRVIWDTHLNGYESHVDRKMNVWGSGGAHQNYFRKVDEVIEDIFNRPIDQQPSGIADMGCGDGSLLAHIFDVIWHKTKRAGLLEQYPLFIIGSDYNQAAIEVAKENLSKADIWANVIFGDIGDPTQFATHLKNEYNLLAHDLLNVRSFLDHNRQYEPPTCVEVGRMSRSSGAFAYRGQRINNNVLEQNLVDHFRKWAPLVGKFGLLVLELHTIPPKLAALNIGRTNVTAYDGTHGYSDQYIVEQEVFLSAAKEAGLTPDNRFQARYPDSDLATVTVNLLHAA